MSALAFCGYTYAFAWGRTLPFDAVPLAIDGLLFSVFALHHSLFARDSVKQRIALAVPQTLLRSVYVWFASVLLIVVCAAWQPIGGDLYHHTGALAVLHGLLQLSGAVIIIQTVRLIDPLDLAGIRIVLSCNHRPHSRCERAGTPVRIVPASDEPRTNWEL